MFETNWEVLQLLLAPWMGAVQGELGFSAHSGGVETLLAHGWIVNRVLTSGIVRFLF